SAVSAAQRPPPGAPALLQLAEQVDRELPGLGLLQLVERKRRVGRQPPSPAGPGVEERRGGESEQEDREIAEAPVGPVDVLEDEHRRPVAGDRFDEAPDREEQRLTVGDRALAVEPEQEGERAGP